MRSRFVVRRRIVHGTTALIAVTIFATFIWLVIGPAADLIAAHDVASLPTAMRAAHLEAARQTARSELLTLGAGFLAAGALLFTGLNFFLARQGHVTDRYTKAVEQLGSDKLDVRIGSIYALERIARDSRRDQSTILEVLAALIREHSRDLGPTIPADSARPDVLAAAAVIGRLNWRRDPVLLDLADARLINARLAHADFTGADLTGADLHEANMTHAELGFAQLSGSNLSGADLSWAWLHGADLSNANLSRANLDHANLFDTNFTGADLSNAILTNTRMPSAAIASANFTGADLTNAEWPRTGPVPAGWERDSYSWLRRSDEQAGPTTG